DRTLEEAVEAVLAGRDPEQQRVKPIGCPLTTTLGTKTKTGGTADAPTYAKDVSRVLQERCVGCHHDGGVGPFALETYDQARAWSDDVVAFTKNGKMPPWKPVAGWGEFHGERTMPPAERDLLARWVKGGTPEGDAKDLPPPLTHETGWRLGEPDVVLKSGEQYKIAATGRDEYRCYVLPTHYDHDLYVRGFEVRPGNKRVVHHVLTFIDAGDGAKKLDAADPKPGYASAGGPPGFLPIGSLGGWAPGGSPRFFMNGAARVLPKSATVVIQVHYHPTGKEEFDSTSIALYLMKEPPKRVLRSTIVTPPGARFSGMRIEPGDANYTIGGSRTLKTDTLLTAITPHMHLLGKEMKLTATLPDGSEKRVLWIDDWDFNWQETFQLKQPLLLPAGTRIDLRARYDNSADNPSNPSRPPKLVQWGEGTTDEMCMAFLEVTTPHETTLAAAKPPSGGAMLRELYLDPLYDGVRARLNRWRD
ncbi:MAG: hypothetical protein ACRDD1_13410, partial [Planctomycetia bacterium]